MVHLHAHSWFSFMGAASSPVALAKRAAEFNQPALALTDDWTLAGSVQHALACKIEGIRPVHGARVVVDGINLVLLAGDLEGYATLCDLLTWAHRERLSPALWWKDLPEYAQGLFCLVDLRSLMTQGHYRKAAHRLEKLKAVYPQRLFIELIHHELSGDRANNYRLQQLAEYVGVPYVASNAVRHAKHLDFPLYDALFCAQHCITVEQSHPLRPVNDAAALCRESYYRWAGLPLTAIANTEAIARECDVNLLAPVVTPPPATIPEGIQPQAYLRALCQEGFKTRYGHNRAAKEQLEKELHIIHHLELDEFFLVVREVVEFARSRRIRCSGRGSAANSVVAYLLGITAVDPIKHKLLFERFLHEGRTGMPDIDVDFDTSRRDEVIEWMHQRWGERHTAMTANIITFRMRSAVREMAKVLGYPLAKIDQATKLVPHAGAKYVHDFRDNLAEVFGESKALGVLCALVERLQGCPRHLGLHSGGMILSRQPLRYLSPIQTSANGVRQIQFSKDDVERLGLIKFDVLGLRMLAAIGEAQTQIDILTLPDEPRTSVDEFPDEDPATFELIRSGETLGLFQIESPGQWNLLSKVRPETFDDLVAQVALFRPGPLQGNMVHPYILRRRGVAKVIYPHPSLEPVLKDTYGIILYQEQVLEVAHVFAGLSLSQADEFRKLMSRFRDPGEMEAMRERFVKGAIETHKDTKHPVPVGLANRVFDLVSHFVGYGFCRSHAAAFAKTVYQSAYLKTHYPAQYMCGVLEHQPGFYPIQTLLEEAKRMGVAMLPVCLHRSEVKYSLDYKGSTLAIRIPFTQVHGISVEKAREIVFERAMAPFESLQDALERLPLQIDDWESLARSGALLSFGERRQVLWEVRAFLRARHGSKGKRGQHTDQLTLDMQALPAPPPLSALQRHDLLRWDFETHNQTAGPHPLTLHRYELSKLGILSTASLKQHKGGTIVRVAGSVISRQRPPTAKGMCFIILEDETGYVPTAMVPQVYEQFSRVLRAPQLVVEGKLEDSGKLAGNSYRSILIQRIWSLDAVCRHAREIIVTGAAGHPGESPRTASTRSRIELPKHISKLSREENLL